MKTIKEKLTWRRKLELLPMPILAGLFIGIIAGMYVFGLPENTVVVTQEKEVRVDYSLQEKIEELKHELIADLRHEETGGIRDEKLKLIFDPKDTERAECNMNIEVRLHCYSWGDFQYKVGTVQYYYLTLYGKIVDDKEAMLIALDEQKAWDLTYDVIFVADAMLSEWVNSSKKIDAKKRLEFIKELEQ